VAVYVESSVYDRLCMYVVFPFTPVPRKRSVHTLSAVDSCAIWKKQTQLRRFRVT